MLKGATRLFDGQVQGSESVTFAPDGRLILLDKYARVLQVREGGQAGARPWEAPGAAQGTAGRGGKAPGLCREGGAWAAMQG